MLQFETNSSRMHHKIGTRLLHLVLVSWWCVDDVVALSLAPLQERTVVLLYNKPPNVVTSHAVEDVKGRRNVYQDIYSMQGWVVGDGSGGGGGSGTHALSFQDVTGIQSCLHAVGRLDADTTGALLLTNDGRLVHHVTNRNAGGDSDAHCLPKTYHAIIMGHHSNNADIFQRMREQGVDIGQKYGGQTLPVADLHVVDHPSNKSTTVSLTISEGKNRQVRRMFHAVGSGVMKLKRVCIGNGLDLGILEEGQWRILSDEEVQTCLLYIPRLLDPSSPEPRTRKRRASFERRKEKSRTRRSR